MRLLLRRGLSFVARPGILRGPQAPLYVQGQSPSPRTREYFYYVDHQGQALTSRVVLWAKKRENRMSLPRTEQASWLFLDDAKVKNFITCFKDKQFLAFFFKQLAVNRSGRYEDSFPYLSPCGREQNYVRCDDRPVVFTHLLPGAAGGELLSYCGGAERLAVPFQPEKLLMLPENGRLYHPGPEKAGGVGLVKSSLAFELSPCFQYDRGPGQPPTHFHWQNTRRTLTNELLPLIRGQMQEEGAQD